MFILVKSTGGIIKILFCNYRNERGQYLSVRKPLKYKTPFGRLLVKSNINLLRVKK